MPTYRIQRMEFGTHTVEYELEAPTPEAATERLSALLYEGDETEPKPRVIDESEWSVEDSNDGDPQEVV